MSDGVVHVCRTVAATCVRSRIASTSSALLALGERDYVARLYAACPFPPNIVLASAWSEVARLAPAPSCLVVVSQHLSAELVHDLNVFRDARPELTVIVVVRRDADSARTAARAGVNEHFWTSDSPAGVWEVVRAATDGHQLRTAIERVLARSSVPVLIRRALLLATRSSVGSVDEWAARLGCNRRTLWRAWHGASPRSNRGATALRLEDLLAWILLIRAVSMHAKASWEVRANDLGVHVRTLARSCRRLAGMPLKEAGEAGLEAVLTRFEAVLAAHIGAPPNATHRKGDKMP